MAVVGCHKGSIETSVGSLENCGDILWVGGTSYDTPTIYRTIYGVRYLKMVNLKGNIDFLAGEKIPTGQTAPEKKAVLR